MIKMPRRGYRPSVGKCFGSVLSSAFFTGCTAAFLIQPGLAKADLIDPSVQIPMENIVTTATREEADAMRLQGSISGLPGKVLELSAHTHIQETLLRIPGVNLQRGNGQEYLPAIRSPVLTGAGACGAFLMAEDGIPLRAAGFCNINELFEAHTEQAQRIEVLRGPGTALHGSNALHGIVNVITPDALSNGGAAGFEFGPYDYSRVKLRRSMHSDNTGFGVNVTLTHDGGYRDDSGFDQQKISARYRSQGERADITTGLSYSNLNQETAGYIEGEDAYKSRTLSESNPDPEAYRDARALRLWSRIDLQLADADHLVVTPYLRYTDMDFLQHFLPGNPLEENGQKSVGVQTAWYQQLSEDLALITGLDAELTQGFLKQSQGAPTQGSVFLQETIPSGKHYDYEVDAWVMAPFAHLDWRLADRWLLTAGLRYEHMDYDYDNRMLAGRTRDDGTTCGFGGCRYSRPEDGEDRFNNWSPKLGISYQLAQTHTAYFNLARGFRAPQATELYRLQRDQQVVDLDSERIDSLELGLKGQTPVLDYSLAVYLMEKDNFIFRDSDYFNVSDGETTHRGIEVELLYRISDRWDAGVNASYAQHRYDHDQLLTGININGNDIDSAPEHFGSARLGWNFSDHSRLELEWLHMGSYYLDPENLHQYEGHDLLNLRAMWSPRPGWRLYGRVLNLTNEEYAERADYTRFSEQRYFPGTPLTLFVGVEWQWR